MLKQLQNNEITIDKFCDSYSGWRVHTEKGNCKKLVEKYDLWLRSEVEKLGYKLEFKERKVTYHVKEN